VFQPSPLPRRIGAALRDAQDPKAHVRLSALGDLSKLADGEARVEVLAAIERLLLRDPEAQVRALAAEALADAAAVSSLPALFEALSDAHLPVRQMVLLAVGEVSPPEHAPSCEVIRQQLTASAPAMRFQALLAAGRVKLPELAQALVRTLGDADASVRYVALRLIDEQLTDALAESEATLLGAAEKRLGDEDVKVRVAAALLLAPRSPTLGHSILVDAVNSGLKLPAAVDEQALLELVGTLGLEAAQPGLRRHARGLFGLTPGPFAWQAKVALAQLGEPTALREIARGLRSRRRDTRSLAVAAAGQARLGHLRPELERLAAEQAVDSEVVAAALLQLPTQV
jgi:HEAT repeats